jgi:hypothetical protein
MVCYLDHFRWSIECSGHDTRTVVNAVGEFPVAANGRPEPVCKRVGGTANKVNTHEYWPRVGPIDEHLNARIWNDRREILKSECEVIDYCRAITTIRRDGLQARARSIRFIDQIDDTPLITIGTRVTASTGRRSNAQTE